MQRIVSQLENDPMHEEDPDDRNYVFGMPLYDLDSTPEQDAIERRRRRDPKTMAFIKRAEEALRCYKRAYSSCARKLFKEKHRLPNEVLSVRLKEMQEKRFRFFDAREHLRDVLIAAEPLPVFGGESPASVAPSMLDGLPWASILRDSPCLAVIRMRVKKWLDDQVHIEASTLFSDCVEDMLCHGIGPGWLGRVLTLIRERIPDLPLAVSALFVKAYVQPGLAEKLLAEYRTPGYCQDIDQDFLLPPPLDMGPPPETSRSPKAKRGTGKQGRKTGARARRGDKRVHRVELGRETDTCKVTVHLPARMGSKRSRGPRSPSKTGATNPSAVKRPRAQ